MNNIRVLSSSVLIALVSVISLISTGCTSIYTERYFSSKQEFYDYINKSVKGRVVNVTLKNDSTFATNENGAQIENDSLLLFLSGTEKDKVFQSPKIKYQNYIPLTEVNSVGYKNTTQGIISGALTGILAGVLLTISKVIPANQQEGNPPYPEDYNYASVGVISIAAGILVGGILGGIIGYHYNYEFK